MGRHLSPFVTRIRLAVAFALLGAVASTARAGNFYWVGDNVALGSNQTWTNNSSNVLSVSGAISGSSNLTIAGLAGNGGFNFSGANGYSGSTTLSTAGASLTLSGANGGILSTSAISLNPGTT